MHCADDVEQMTSIKLKYCSNIRIRIHVCSHHMPVRLKDSPKSQRTRLQHAEWLGNSTALIIITDNDIYLRQSPADEEDLRLTHTGVPGLIYNGVADWLYQGEIKRKHRPAAGSRVHFFRQRKFSNHKRLCGGQTMAPSYFTQPSTTRTSVR